MKKRKYSSPEVRGTIIVAPRLLNTNSIYVDSNATTTYQRSRGYEEYWGEGI
ncbi:MAG: hypothetical protein K5683_08000 [Prevotella sp.]|nr:hypothetical protein [Prevotella sp.]